MAYLKNEPGFYGNLCAQLFSIQVSLLEDSIYDETLVHNLFYRNLSLLENKAKEVKIQLVSYIG